MYAPRLKMTFDPEGNLWEVTYRPLQDGSTQTTQCFPAAGDTGTLRDEDRLTIATTLMEVDPDIQPSLVCSAIHGAYVAGLRTITQ